MPKVRVSLQESEGRCERAITAERARIAERTTVAVATVDVREDTERVCITVRCHTWKRVRKTVVPCVAMLCVDVDTVHECCKTTGLPLFRKNVCCRRSAE